MRLLSAAVLILAAQAATANDTWLAHAAAGDPPTGFMGVAFDSELQRLYVVAGAETWTWDGSAWTEHGGPSPPSRFMPAMVYDSRRSRVVLFGGFDAGVYLADTWEHDGTRWTQASPSTSPPGRSQGGLAFDEDRGVSVLFGGVGEGAALVDTWLWNGAEWNEVTPEVSPEGRRFPHSMAYDASRQSVLMIGGIDDESEVFWEWNGATWAQMPPTPFQAVEQYLAMAPLGKCLALFTDAGETWVWNGANASWTQVLTDASPGPRSGFIMAGDGARPRAFLYGGAGDTTPWELTVDACAAERPRDSSEVPTACGCAHGSGHGVFCVALLALFKWRRTRQLSFLLLLSGCGLQQFVDLRAGSTHTCGLTDTGRASCWGENEGGATDAPDEPFTAVRAGTHISCGLRDDGSAECWGFLAPPPRAGPFATIEAGAGAACGLLQDGTLECWSASLDNPLLQSPPGTFRSLSVDISACALDDEDRAHCWPNSETPTTEFRTLDAGLFACGIRVADSRVECWGGGGQEPAPPDEPFEALTVGLAHVCAIRSDASLSCWGATEDGISSPPRGEFVQVSAGSAHTCALRTDGTAACWGRNDHGQAFGVLPARVRDRQRDLGEF